MQTDFAAVRQYLEAAWLHIHGNDEAAGQVRDMLDQLIEAVAVAEHTQPSRPAEILPFRKAAKRF